MTERSTPLRVLHLASWYPSDAHGTLGNFVQRHVEAVGTVTRSEVWFVAQGPPRVERRTVRGVEECIVYQPKSWWPWGLTVTRALLRLARKAERPDVLHVHVLYPAGVAARWLAHRWGIPLVVTEHWTAYHPDQRVWLPRARRWAMRWAGRGADRLCPVTEQLGVSMAGFGLNAPVQAVPNVVDTSLFQPHPRSTPPVLLHISSLVDEQKNVTGLLHAFRAVRDQLPAGTTLDIIGDGDPRPHAATAAALGLSASVRCSGEIPLSEVADRMARARAVLLFSRYENFPCVIPEAWAAGTPVLVTDVGGIREHVPVWPNPSDRGWCTPSEDPGTWGAALVELLKNTPDADRLHAHSEAHFSIAAIAQAYLAVYHQVLGHG